MPRTARLLLVGVAPLAALALMLGACDRREPGPPPPIRRPPGGAPAARPPVVRPPSGAILSVAVDRRVELLGLLCRLAGYPEYARPAATDYVREIDRVFAAHRSHRAVEMTANLRQRPGISHEKPVRLAVYLDGRYRPRRALHGGLPGLEAWARVSFDLYLAAVQDFAARSGFDAFFEAQRAHHAAVEQRFRQALAVRPSVTAFYDSIFGPRPTTRYHLAPGLMVGPWDYSALAEPVPGRPEVHAVMTAEDGLDAGGLPRPGDRTHQFLVHEVGHAYVNPLVEAHRARLAPLATPVFERVRDVMTRQSYGTWEVMLDEAWVRALVLIFIRDWLGRDAALAQLRREQQRGFYFIETLARRLDTVHRQGGSSAVMVDEVAAVLDEWARAPH